METSNDNRAGQDTEDTLELIPRSVRDKLDRIGIKVHLKEWQLLSLPERRLLRDLPCAADQDVARYARAVEHLIRRHTGKPAERLRREP